jgi:putative transposase
MSQHPLVSKPRRRVSELRRLRQLEEENRKLKQLVADLSLDKAMLQDVLSKKL